jgi:hypothetical protein
MDTIQSLYTKYINSLTNDIAGGCVRPSQMTNELLAFYQEVIFRLSAQVNDQITANQLLTYTATNYR